VADHFTQQIIGSAVEVHRILGPGLLESIYEEALCHEFELRLLPYARQVAVDIHYKDKIIREQRLDLIVFGEVIVEVKSVRHLPEVSSAQVLSYLKATGFKRALLINFGTDQLRNGIKRISL